MSELGTIEGVQGQRILTAGSFRLDCREGRLTRDGEVLALSGKPLALLEALMSAAPNLLTKEEIFERVWLGRAVSEAVLTTAIRQIRNALGDDARNPAFIETVHGRGYRFLASVTSETEPTEAPAPAVVVRVRRRFVPAFALLGAAMATLLAWIVWGGNFSFRPELPVHPKSIAILPLSDLSQGRDAQWFADGLTEELLNSLSRAPDIRVASRGAGQSLATEQNPAATARRKLRAAHLLEGSVRRDSGRVRVSVRLTHTADGFMLWSEDYDRPQEDVISIQEEIAFKIATALKTVMEPEKLRAMVEAGTRSVEAYEIYLQGAALGRKGLASGDISQARASRESYERARAIDPGFAAAHWAAASTWFGSVTRTDANSVPEGKSYAELLAGYFERVDAAISACRNDAERERYRAARAIFSIEPKAALRHIEAYLAVRPRDLEAWDELARIAAYSGDLSRVSRAAAKMHALSLETSTPMSRAITITVMAREPEKAVRRARRQLALQPEGALMNYQAHRAFIQTGRIEEARPMLDLVNASDLPLEVKLLAQLRQACAEVRIDGALDLAAEIYGTGSLGARWQAAQILGDDTTSHALLAPLDNPEGFPTLLQFMFQPTFDPEMYPALKARLQKAGAVIRPAAAMPHSCRGLTVQPVR